jgi:hypothetical protein
MGRPDMSEHQKDRPTKNQNGADGQSGREIGSQRRLKMKTAIEYILTAATALIIIASLWALIVMGWALTLKEGM